MPYVGREANSFTTVVDVTVSDDLTVTDDATIGGTALVTGVLTTTAATVFNGGFAANDGSTITTADNTTQLTLASTDADGSVGPVLDLYRNSSSPAINDRIGSITFTGENAAGEIIEYVSIDSFIRGVTDGAEDAQMNFQSMVAGANVSRMEFEKTETNFNKDSVDVDFRVESNGNANALFVDAGNDKIGMFTSNPTDYYADTVVITTPDEGGITLVTGTGHANYLAFADGTSGDARYRGYVYYDHNTDKLLLAANSATKVSISASDVVLNDVGADVDFRVESVGHSDMFNVDAAINVVAMGKTGNTGGAATEGVYFSHGANQHFHQVMTNESTNTSHALLYLNRQSVDNSTLINFMHEDNVEGSITVNGSTVSYNGFSGRHESSGIPLDTPLGTVVSTIDELDVYPDRTTDVDGNAINHLKAGQTRTDHPKVEVSNSVGDSCVYGYVSGFDGDGKLIVTSVGIGSVRVTGACAKGDLLESNGDGTAKVQSDDIVRSKTIGKVTIGNSDTGVKLVSCVMYCG